MATDPADFRYTYPFRFLVPLASLATWLSLLFGPFFFRLPWLVTICVAQLVYAAFGVAQARRALRASADCVATIDAALARDDTNATSETRHHHPDTALHLDSTTTANAPSPFYHAFVIPNYKEPVELLEATLSTLRKHPAAKSRYVIVLAMESAEPAHDTKAKQLTTTFAHDFHTITHTSHTLTPPESRGKASNVSYAVSHLADNLPAAIAVDDVLVTVLDADALVHRCYTEEVDRVVAGMEWEGGEGGEGGGVRWTVFAPPVVFERNWEAVAAPARVQDFSWAAMAFQNLVASSGVAFPLSVYTIPLRLCVDMGFWDTNDEAIAEDYHTFLKAFFKTHGRVRLCPILIPVNLVNLQDDGWLKTCVARAVQAERHFRGVVDVAYTCRHALPRLHRGWAYWVVLAKVFETHFLPPIAPWYMMVAGPFCQLLQWLHGFFEGPELVLLVWVQAFGLVGLVVLVTAIVSFERMRRHANRHLFNRPNPSFLSFAHYAWMAVNVWIFVIPPYALASFKWLLPLGPGEYKVAQKKFDFAAEAARDEDRLSSDSSVAPDPLEGVVVVGGGEFARDESPSRVLSGEYAASGEVLCRADSRNDSLEQLIPAEVAVVQVTPPKEKCN